MIDAKYIDEQTRLIAEARSKPDRLTPEERKSWRAKVNSAHGLDEYGRLLVDEPPTHE
jgi:hypothetical protein